MISKIPNSTFEFLTDLKQHNSREWFNAHKDDYLTQLELITGFADTVLFNLNRHDVIETPSGKKSLRRIYRDSRFSTDKTPYSCRWSGGFRRAGIERRGGYVFHIAPGNSFAGGGFRAPNPSDLRLIRNDISFDPVPLRQIITQPQFLKTFGSLRGNQLETTPKGFAPDDEAIDLLRFKQFILVHKFTDEEVLSPQFPEHIDQTFRTMRPFLDYMSAVLSTDVNGEGLL